MGFLGGWQVVGVGFGGWKWRWSGWVEAAFLRPISNFVPPISH